MIFHAFLLSCFHLVCFPFPLLPTFSSPPHTSTPGGSLGDLCRLLFLRATLSKVISHLPLTHPHTHPHTIRPCITKTVNFYQLCAHMHSTAALAPSIICFLPFVESHIIKFPPLSFEAFPFMSCILLSWCHQKVIASKNMTRTGRKATTHKFN